MVQLLHEGAVVATHVRRERGRATTTAHYPPEKIAFHMRTPTWCRHAAQQVGPACTAVVGDLLAVNALFRLRAAQGVLGLRDNHTPARLEAACAKAITVGDPSYRTIKGILIAGTETTDPDGWPGDLDRRGAVVPAFPHGPQALFALDDDDLAPVLELPTHEAHSPGTGHPNQAAGA